jgi:hypothetical protein
MISISSDPLSTHANTPNFFILPRFLIIDPLDSFAYSNIRASCSMINSSEIKLILLEYSIWY